MIITKIVYIQIHNNDTNVASSERTKGQHDTSTLFQLYQNLTKRVSSMEKITSPPYETKTINFMIPDWHATLASGLEDEFIEYEVGSLLGHRSTWKAYLQLNEDRSHLSIHNVMLKSDMAMFNELEIQILDGDGRVFTSCETSGYHQSHISDMFNLFQSAYRRT